MEDSNNFLTLLGIRKKQKVYEMAKEIKKATKPKEKAFINATEGLKGFFAQLLRGVFAIPEPKNQR